MAITKRLVKGSALTHAELDGNFTDLDGRLLLTASAALSVVAASGASQTVNVASFGVVDITLSASTTLTVTGADTTKSFALTLVLRQDATGGRTVTFPAGVKWAGGSAPTLTTTANCYDVVRIFTNDGGSTWIGQVIGLNYSNATALASDLFTRANSTTTMGSADVGGAWTIISGTWGINTNRGTAASGVSTGAVGLAVFNTGVANVDISCTITSAVANSAACVMARCSASGNEQIVCGFEVLQGAIRLYKVLNGAYTHLGTSTVGAAAFNTPQTVRLKIVGSVIDVYLNGTRDAGLSGDYSAQLTGTLLTNTRHGLRDDTAGNFYDNFQILAA